MSQYCSLKDLAASTATGAINITTVDVATQTIALGTSTAAASETVDATLMTDGHTLTLTGSGALTLSSTNADIAAGAYVGAITETLTTGAGVTSAVTLGSGVDLVTVTGVNATAVINLTTGASADEVFVGGTAPAAGSSYALNAGANIVHIAGGDLSNNQIVKINLTSFSKQKTLLECTIFSFEIKVSIEPPVCSNKFLLFSKKLIKYGLSISSCKYHFISFIIFLKISHKSEVVYSSILFLHGKRLYRP